MERFECKYMNDGGVCFRRCSLNFSPGSETRPACCVIDGAPCRWERVNQLPVLSSEELKKQGVEWPGFANFATVNDEGRLVFWEDVPEVVKHPALCKEYWELKNGFGFRPLSPPHLRFDASDWKTRIVKRPALVPDWCKPGALVCLNEETPKLCKVIGVSADNGVHVHCYFMSGGQRDNRFVPISSLSPVIMVPWDEKQMSEKVGKVFDFPSSRELCAYYEKGKGLKFGVGGSDFYSAKALAQSIEITFEGQPCGWLTEGKR